LLLRDIEFCRERLLHDDLDYGNRRTDPWCSGDCSANVRERVFDRIPRIPGYEFMGLSVPERALRAALALGVLLVDPLIHVPAFVLAVALVGWRTHRRPRDADTATVVRA
jgi:hypothetical protein